MKLSYLQSWIYPDNFDKLWEFFPTIYTIQGRHGEGDEEMNNYFGF